MTFEFKKRVEELEFDEETRRKTVDLVRKAGEEFPCLLCPSKDDWENFKWYKKWFKE
jgi:hypothetical protein